MLAVTSSEAARFAKWMSANAALQDARLGEALTGGNANVTRLVESAEGRFVLRHPPAQAVSDKAAGGIEREYRLLCAVDGAAPVPKPIAFCADTSVLGVPFMVVEHVDGVAISDKLPAAYKGDTATIDRIGFELVDALAAVHRIDWRASLASGFGRPDGFVARQIDRWTEVRARDSVRTLPLLEQLSAWLRDNVPPPAAPAILHCDYHLDNTLFDRSRPRLMAIIDWEMATIGDPRVDLGLLLMFWRRREEDSLGFRFVQRISNRPDVVAPEALADRWSRATGCSIEAIDYFRVFAFWRLAAIVEGAWVLQRRGLVDTPYARGLATDVPNLLQEAAAVIG